MKVHLDSPEGCMHHPIRELRKSGRAALSDFQPSIFGEAEGMAPLWEG